MSRMTVGKLERKIAALQAKADEFAAMAEHSQSKVVRKISAFMAEDALEQIKPWQEKRDRLVARQHGISVETVRAIDNAVLSLETVRAEG
jgi:hypothetical protein